MNGVIHLDISGKPRKVTRRIRCCKRKETVWTDSNAWTVWRGEALVFGELVELLSLNTIDWFPALIEDGLQHFPGKHCFSDRELRQLEMQGYIY